MRGFVARIFSTILGGLIGFAVALYVYSRFEAPFANWANSLQEFKTSIPPIFAESKDVAESFAILRSLYRYILIAFFVLGYLMTPLVEMGLAAVSNGVQRLLKGVTRQRFIAGTIGFLGGVLVSFFLLNVPLFFYLNSLPQNFINSPFVMVLVNALFLLTFGYIGGFITTTIFYPTSSRESILSQYEVEVKPRILDTSVIIDGRITEIVRSGFLSGLMVVPNSVIRELQLIADSSDQIKRNKGRRGLEILKNLQENSPNPVHILDDNKYDKDHIGVDERLILVAEELGGEVVTNDYNLNRVAGIKDIKVLNMNELANAVKPMVIPGETLLVSVIREGKESGQGVGYLDDGTMVVVEQGLRHIGSICEVEVTSIMQTVAGRLIFGRVRKVVKDEV
jgi:uncharacterized protein YacL